MTFLTFIFNSSVFEQEIIYHSIARKQFFTFRFHIEQHF